MADSTNPKPLEQLKVQAQHAEAVTAVQAHAGAAPAIVPRPVRRYRALLFQGYVVAATIAFGALFIYARTIAYFAFDFTLEHWVQSFNPYWFDALMRFVSALGFSPQAEILTALFILFVIIIGLRWEAAMLIFAEVGVSALGALVKVIVQRPRPTAALVNVFAPINDYSFPSGHVLLFTAFLGFLFFYSTPWFRIRHAARWVSRCLARSLFSSESRGFIWANIGPAMSSARICSAVCG